MNLDLTWAIIELIMTSSFSSSYLYEYEYEYDNLFIQGLYKITTLALHAINPDNRQQN